MNKMKIYYEGSVDAIF